MTKEEKDLILQKARAAKECVDTSCQNCNSCKFKDTTFCDAIRSDDAFTLSEIIDQLIDVIEVYEVDAEWIKIRMASDARSILRALDRMEFN